MRVRADALTIPDGVRRRRPWFNILRDLMAAGVSMAQVARKCGRDTTTVGNWANGVDPKETDARIVLTLYARHCPQKYAEHEREYGVPPLSAGDDERTL